MPIKVLSIFLIVFSISCEELPELDNIFEAPSSEQIPEITSVSSNINGSSADFSWDSNDYALEFSYLLSLDSLSGGLAPEQIVNQSYFDWSDWNTQDSKGFSDLDEGIYTFFVKSRFDSEKEEVKAYENTIEIDNIPSSSLRIYPQNQRAQAGEEIDIFLLFEDVPQESAVTGLHVDISINAAELAFVPGSFELGKLVTQFSGTTIYPTPTYSDDGTTMSINGVADGNGVGIYGTGPIAKFRIRVLASSGKLKIDIGLDGSYQDINNNPIGFQNPFGGSVTVGGSGQ